MEPEIAAAESRGNDDDDSTAIQTVQTLLLPPLTHQLSGCLTKILPTPWLPHPGLEQCWGGAAQGWVSLVVRFTKTANTNQPEIIAQSSSPGPAASPFQASLQAPIPALATVFEL